MWYLQNAENRLKLSSGTDEAIRAQSLHLSGSQMLMSEGAGSLEKTHTHTTIPRTGCCCRCARTDTHSNNSRYAATVLRWDHLCSKSSPPLSTLLFFVLQYFPSSLTLHSLFAHFPFHPSYSAASPPHLRPPTSSLFPLSQFLSLHCSHQKQVM